MAIRSTYAASSTRYANPDLVIFRGRVAVNNSAGALTVNAGRGVTAAISATTGQLVITLPISFQTLIDYQFTQAQATVADHYQKVVAWSTTNRTISINNYAGGGTTNTAFGAAATYNEISFNIAVQTSSTPAT